MGLDSRSDIKKCVRAGQVLVDGVPVKDAGLEVTEGSTVVYRGTTVFYEALSWWMVHKPAGVLSATEDKKRTTVLDLLPKPVRKDLFPVGRLDIDTTGLILITNDGELAHRLLAPKSHVDKRYLAGLSVPAPSDAEARFAEGVDIGDLVCLPALLSFPDPADRTQALAVLREGKFHQVKRMFSAVGTEVVSLKRLSIGPLVLDETLAPGETRRLLPEEVRALYEAVNLPAPV